MNIYALPVAALVLAVAGCGSSAAQESAPRSESPVDIEGCVADVMASVMISEEAQYQGKRAQLETSAPDHVRPLDEGREFFRMALFEAVPLLGTASYPQAEIRANTEQFVRHSCAE